MFGTNPGCFLEFCLAADGAFERLGIEFYMRGMIHGGSWLLDCGRKGWGLEDSWYTGTRRHKF